MYSKDDCGKLTNKEWFHYNALSGGLFSYTNGAHDIFCLSFVLWSFQVLGKDLMGYGTRSGKSLSLGIPMAPQDNLRTHKAKAWGCPGRHPLFRLLPSVTLLGTIFLFTTWYVFCLERLVWFESLIFSLPQSSLLYTPFERNTHDLKIIRIFYVLHLYLLSYIVFALVLHLYLLEHGGGFVL